MAIVDGNPVNAAYTNSVLASKTVDNELQGVQDLNNTADPNSGAQVPNLQQRVNELSDMTGQVDGSGTNTDYATNNIISDGQTLKQAIEALDAAPGGGASQLNDLSDVTIVAAPNQKLQSNGVNQYVNVDDTLDNLTDVTGGSALQLLRRNAGDTAYEFITDLSDRIIGAGTASASNKLKLSSESLANLTALARDAGAIYFDTTNQVIVLDDGTNLIDLTQTGGPGASDLDSLTDVTITAVAANQKLKRNAGNTQWENVDDSLDSLNDVTPAGSALQLLIRNAGNTAYEFITDLTNRILGGGTASATNKIKLSTETLVNLTALARDEGALYYDDTNNTVVYDDGTSLIDLAASGTVAELTDIGDVSGPVSAFQVMVRNAAGTAFEFVSQLSNIILGGGTASATNRIQATEDTLANITALPRVRGAIYAATDNSNVYYDDGTTLIDLTSTGSGGGMTVNSTVSQVLGSYTVPASTIFDGSLVIGPAVSLAAGAGFGFIARIQGSLGAGVVVTSENDAGWVDSVTRTAAGEYTVDFTSRGFTETPAILVAIENNGAVETSTQYVINESNTSCDLKVGLVDQDGDRDFSIHVIPVGADAVASSVDFYAGRVSSTRVVGSQTSAFIDSVGGSSNNYTINYAGLGLSAAPTIVVTPVDPDGLPSGQDIITNLTSLSNTSANVRFTVNGGATPTPDFSVILIPASADIVSFGAGIGYSADIDLGGATATVTGENISGWIDTATRTALGNLTIDFTSLGFTVPPAAFVIGRDTAAGFFAPANNTGVTTTQATFIVSNDGQTSRVDEAFQVIIIPQGADFQGSGVPGIQGDEKILPLKNLAPGTVVEVVGGAVIVDGIGQASLQANEQAKINGAAFDI